MAGASKAISVDYIDTVSCFQWCLNIWGYKEEWTLDIRCCSHRLALDKTCCLHDIVQPTRREAPSPATLLWGAGTVRNQSLRRNNSCFYLCNGCRTTVHILARWSCHKSLILGLSVGPRCQVVFGHLWLDRSRTHHLSRHLTPSPSYKMA